MASLISGQRAAQPALIPLHLPHECPTAPLGVAARGRWAAAVDDGPHRAFDAFAGCGAATGSSGAGIRVPAMPRRASGCGRGALGQLTAATIVLPNICDPLGSLGRIKAMHGSLPTQRAGVVAQSVWKRMNAERNDSCIAIMPLPSAAA
jgi:hypothetical protein